MSNANRQFNGVYEGEYLNKTAFPLGGIGAGMICLEGMGALSHVSLRHKPDVMNTPCIFSALKIKGDRGVAKILEGPVAGWKIMYPFNSKYNVLDLATQTANGVGAIHFGLPRFDSAAFRARFPFGSVCLTDEEIPLQVSIEGWSPFIPQDSYNSSLPVAGLEYCFKNNTKETIEATYSFNAMNIMKQGKEKNQKVRRIDNGCVCVQQATAENPEYQGSFAAQVLNDAAVNPAWFRGEGFDPLTMVWKGIADDNCKEKEEITEGDPSPGASIFVALSIPPGEEKRVKLLLSWYVPASDVRMGKDEEDGEDCCAGDCSAKETYRPWYAVEFEGIDDVSTYWKDNYSELKQKTMLFRDTFFDTSLPEEVVEAIAANLSILKSPTVMRQHDGRLWCWEGCCDGFGCCHGSCTHVWNYAQAMAHLFPDLERTLRQTEFNENQNAEGDQVIRAALPIRCAVQDFTAAADGQLGGIMKLHREWLVKGDNDWLKGYWSKARQSLDFCIKSWDPDHKGVLAEPHHNTYDIEFWGPDSMCSSIYLGALKAIILMGGALNEDTSLYQALFAKGREYIETELYNGEYFIQKIEWKNLKAADPTQDTAYRKADYSPEAIELLEKEGPKHQYGNGCLSDGVIGAWMALVCGVGEILDSAKVRSHLLAVHKYNLKMDLSGHANPQRPTFAIGKEGGLLLCSWPHDDALALPFPYSNEVWTGIEYQVASHLMMIGCTEEGFEIVREARKRYNGRARNPFDEYECGHWYARALSSYAMIQGYSGVSYNALDQTLTVEAPLKRDSKTFLSTGSGYGSVEVKDGKVNLDVKSGTIPVRKIVCNKNE